MRLGFIAFIFSRHSNGVWNGVARFFVRQQTKIKLKYTKNGLNKYQLAIKYT
jgi:hypothetical protein